MWSTCLVMLLCIDGWWDLNYFVWTGSLSLWLSTCPTVHPVSFCGGRGDFSRITELGFEKEIGDLTPWLSVGDARDLLLVGVESREIVVFTAKRLRRSRREGVLSILIRVDSDPVQTKELPGFVTLFSSLSLPLFTSTLVFNTHPHMSVSSACCVRRHFVSAAILSTPPFLVYTSRRHWTLHKKKWIIFNTENACGSTYVVHCHPLGWNTSHNNLRQRNSH